MDTTTTSMHIHGAVLTRRQFVKTGGTLIVGVSLGGSEMLTAAIQGAQQAVGRNSLESIACQLVVRGPRRQHADPAHRQERFRAEHGDHGL